jgi:hypothetical protein
MNVGGGRMCVAIEPHTDSLDAVQECTMQLACPHTTSMHTIETNIRVSQEDEHRHVATGCSDHADDWLATCA